MSKYTTDRDEIWNTALDLAQQEYQITINDILDSAELSESKRRTVRRVLRSMESYGWVKQCTKGSRYWNPGPKLTIKD